MSNQDTLNAPVLLLDGFEAEWTAMSNQDTQNVPVLRLDGFEGEWTERPLGSFTKRVQRKNTDLESTLPLTISAQDGLVDQITYFNNRVASDNLMNYLLVKNGEFAYNKSFSEGHPVGAVKRLDKYDWGALSTLYIVFRIAEDVSIDSDYLVTFFETSRWHRFVEARAAEGARNHGLLNISATDFLDVPVSLAPTKNEQQAIGAVFTKLDAAIDQHTNKHRVLQHTKTALMQRMFPQDGQTEPDLRLDGFEWEWHEGLLGDAVVEFSYGLNAAAKAYDGITKYLRITDIHDGTREFRDDNLTSPDMPPELLADYWMQDGDIVFARTGASVGKTFIYTREYGRVAFAGFLIRARVRDEFDPQFVFQQTLTDRYWRYIKIASQRSGQPGVNANEYRMCPVVLPPTLEEQQAIGAVFTKLDSLINAETQLIEKLKQTKTALLQKMFV